MALLLACAASSLPFAVWTIRKSRLPSWMKGALRWPLGDNLSSRVAVLQGWTNLLVGTASSILFVVVLLLPSELVGGAGARTAYLALFAVGLLTVSGAALYVWSAVLSHRRPRA